MVPTFLILISASFLWALPAQNTTTLKLVHVFFRHGSRTPEEKDIYPNDPYKVGTFMPMGYGHLTNSGKQRAYKLGKMFRRRYNDFLGEIYTPDVLLARSTDFDRTKITALLVLAGLYPPAPSQKWDEHVNWLPIPYDFEKDQRDYFIRRPTSYCPNYVKEFDRVMASSEVQRILKDNSKTFQYLTRNTGKSISKLSHAFSLYQTLNAEDYMGLDLPRWTESVYPETLHYLSGKLCNFENYNSILKRLNGGRILKKVIENMVAKANNTLKPENRKLFLFSGHENNVINMLAAMNLFQPHVPKYSSAVIIELHYLEDEDNHVVKVLYSRTVDAEPEEQAVPGCGEKCYLEKFVEVTAANVPDNYTQECNSPFNLD